MRTEKHMQTTATPPSRASLALSSAVLLHREHQTNHMQAHWACDYTITGLYRSTITYPVALSTSGTTLYAGLLNNAIIKWPLERGVKAEKILIESKPIKAIALSYNEETLASSACSNTIKLWNTQSKQLLYTLDAHHAIVESLIFNAQNSLLASSDASGEILLWDINTGTLLHRLIAHALPFGKIVFSPDGTLLAATDCVTADSTSNTILWKTTTGRQLSAFKSNNQRGGALAFDPHNPAIATVSDNCSIALRAISNGEEIARLTEHTSPLASITYSHDGSLLASLSVDGNIVIWDLRACGMRASSRGSKQYCLHYTIPNHHTCIPDQHTEKIYTAIAFSLDDSKIIIHAENRVMNEHAIKIYTLDQID
jgi:WD40 repeat protein